MRWALGILVFFGGLDLPVQKPGTEIVKAPAALPVPPPRVEDPIPATVFYGQEVVGPGIVYVLDFSQTMGQVAERVDYRTTLNRWEVCQREASQSLRGLDPRSRFNVVVFGTGGGCGVQAWCKDLQPASRDNVSAAIGFIASFQNVMFYGGSTPTAPAVIQALAFQPDRVVLLTDGQPSPCGYTGNPEVSHRAAIDRANQDQIPIDVYGVGMWEVSRRFCMGVAGDSGGSFTEVR